MLVCLVAVVTSSTLLPSTGPSAGPVDRSPGLGDAVAPVADLFARAAGGPWSGPGVGSRAPGELGALADSERLAVGGSIGPREGNGIATLSRTPHFTVESPRPAYWRSASYATYTGGGWERAEDRRRFAGETPRSADGTLVQTVTLNRSATVLPAAWRPIDAAVESDRRLYERGGGLSVDRSLPAGATYTVVSARQTPDAAALDAAGADYPRPIEERYARLPPSVPDRVASFTARLTADDGTPYRTATTVERWLRENRAYSLNATHDPDRDVVDQFLFEMEAGYCEYFAASMTVMLRSQGIPARYVVGYTPGTPNGDGTYTVRGMNAHAWVEVYFPDHGWVAFDPTPADARLRAEREALGDADRGRGPEANGTREETLPGTATGLLPVPDGRTASVVAAGLLALAGGLLLVASRRSRRDRIRRRLRAWGSTLLTVLSAGLAGLLVGFAVGVVDRLRAFDGRSLARALGWALPVRVADAVDRIGGRRLLGPSARPPGPAAVEAGGSTADRDDREAVGRAWRRLVVALELDRWRHLTPGEIARMAKAKRYPADAVDALTDAFREVEYGGRDPSPRRAAAETAVDALHEERKEREG